MPLNLIPWVASGIAGIFMLLAVFLSGYQYSNSRREAEIARLNQTIFTLRESIETANEEADRRAKESAKAAKAIEDERNARIEETTRLFAEYEARADADADEYARRVRALGAKACRSTAGSANSGGLPKTTKSDTDRPYATWVVPESTLDDLGVLARQADRINAQFSICKRVIDAGSDVARRSANE